MSIPPTQAFTADNILVDILVNQLTKITDIKPGVVLEGLVAGPWLTHLLNELGADEHWCLTLVGADKEAESALPNLGRRSGVGAEHAVKMRNDNIEGARRLVVKLGDEAKLHSLTGRGYSTLGPDELGKAVAQQGAAQAPNVPQRQFWEQLAKGQPVVPLSGLLQVAAINWNEPDNTDLRQLLPELNLLPDRALFVQPGQVSRRLLDNEYLLERLVQQAPRDVDGAFNTYRRAVKESHPDAELLRAAFAAFKQLSPAASDFSEVLKHLDASLIDSLLNDKLRPINTPISITPPIDIVPPVAPPVDIIPPVAPPVDIIPPVAPPIDINPPRPPIIPPPPRPKPKRGFDDVLDEVVLQLSAESDQATTWMAEAGRLWYSLDKQLNQPRYTLEGDTTLVSGVPDALALILTQHFAGGKAFGGYFPLTADLSPGQPVPIVGVTLPDSAIVYGDAWLAGLRQLLTTASKLVPGFEGASKFDAWIGHRQVLAEFASQLTLAPLTTLLVKPNLLEAARALSQSYEELVSHVRAHYGGLQVAGGASRISAALLSPDIVALPSPGQRAALLSPLHPLTLWKYVAVADELLAGRGPELLPLLGRLSLAQEPLRALLLPGVNDQLAIQLAYVRRISTWLQYQQAGPVEATTNANTVLNAARKLGILYPMIRKKLRLLVHHPDSLLTLKPALVELTKGEGAESFTQIHLLITHRPGQESVLSLSPLDELMTRGVVVPERIEIANISKLAEWLQGRPAHILVLPGQRRLEPFMVSRQATDLHPLSLPHTLQFNQFDGEVDLVPRSQQRGTNSPEHPFGAYHDLTSAIGGLPNQEMSGAMRPRATSPDLPEILPYSVLVIAGAPADPPTRSLPLARPDGSQGDLVLTQYSDRFTNGVKEMLTKSNYQPKIEKVFEILRELEAVGHTSLFGTISAKTIGGFDATALKGQLGQAVALRWYAAEVNDPRYVVISLDSALARRSWLTRRDSSRRNDLLGLRWTSGGGVSLDLIEVKTSEQGVIEGEGTPGEQLRAVARELLPVVTGSSGTGGKLITDCRREALRMQIFREGQLRMPTDYDNGAWAQWVQKINEALDGQLDVKVNLLLTEVLFNHNEDTIDTLLDGPLNATEPENKLKLRRIQLGEPAIRRFIEGDLPPAPEPPLESTPPAEPVSPLVPQDATGSKSPTEPGIGTLTNSAQTSANVSAISDSKPEVIDDHLEILINSDQPTAVLNNNVDAEDVTPPTVPASLPITITPVAPEIIAELATSLYRALQNHDLAPLKTIDPTIADVGPSIIRLKVLLRGKQKVADLQRLATDLQLEMKLAQLPSIGILPGTNYVAVEIGRTDRQPIELGPILASIDSAMPPVSFPAGIGPNGNVVWLTLPRLPHMLIGGTTGSGKTMFLYGLIQALTKLNTPETLELVLIDPKQTDFGFFEHLPHLRGHRIVYEPEEAVEVLNELLATELPRRTALLRQQGCRDIHEYRQKTRPENLPFTIVIIDEFADLIQSLNARDRKQFEENVGRLAQRTRSVGIHLVVATQRPDMKVIPGNLKNNLDCRVAFRLASGTDSRVILDEVGAEDLLGYGDMLLKQQGQVQRLQGFFVSSEELKKHSNKG